MRRHDPEVLDALEDARLPDAPADDAAVVEALRPYLSDARAARIEQVLDARTRRLVVVLDGVHDPHNGGAILRSCEAFGVHEVMVLERDEPFCAARRATRSAHKWLEVQRFREASACLEAVAARGLALYVAGPDGGASLDELAARVGSSAGFALVFGNEHDGVAPAVRAAAHGTFRIPMLGFVESLNVSVSVAVSLHAVRAALDGDLAEREKLRLRARFYRLTVREADAIVRRSLST